MPFGFGVQLRSIFPCVLWNPLVSCSPIHDDLHLVLEILLCPEIGSTPVKACAVVDRRCCACSLLVDLSRHSQQHLQEDTQLHAGCRRVPGGAEHGAHRPARGRHQAAKPEAPAGAVRQPARRDGAPGGRRLRGGYRRRIQAPPGEPSCCLAHCCCCTFCKMLLCCRPLAPPPVDNMRACWCRSPRRRRTLGPHTPRSGLATTTAMPTSISERWAAPFDHRKQGSRCICTAPCCTAKTHVHLSSWLQLGRAPRYPRRQRRSVICCLVSCSAVFNVRAHTSSA